MLCFKKCLAVMLVVLTGFVSSCQYDDDELWDSVNDLAARVSALESLTKQMNGDISAVQGIVSALEKNVSVSFCVTKLLLILWGEPHRNKKHCEGVTLSPPGVAQGERGYLRGRKHKRDPLQTQGKGNAIGAGTCEHYRRKRERDGTGSRHTGEGQEGWTRSHKATWVPPSSRLPFSASAA